MVKKREKRQLDAQAGDSSTDSADEKATAGAAGNGLCQHIKKAVDTQRLRKSLNQNGLATECSQCSKRHKATLNSTIDTEARSESLYDESSFEYDNTLWLCLKCGSQLCGRNKNQHALQHHKTPHSDSHALTMNTRSFDIWCYECSNEVSVNERKSLQDCVDIVRKAAQKADTVAKTLNNTMLSCNQAVPLPPPMPIPGMAKRVNETGMLDSAESTLAKLSALPVISGNHYGPSKQQQQNYNYNYALQQQQKELQQLPRVRGLTNLGNTCFFNAVMQCLAQTPFLLDVLKETEQPGEEFTLPGGTFKFKDELDVELPPIKGTLASWGTLTSSLAQALEELQSGGSVFTPSRLFDKLCSKCPQFRGGDQHDSHELLRHLLESVRSEDLKRYQRVILQSLGYTDQLSNNVPEEMRMKCKIYGNQAADRILRPEQVFRGFLVSTLTCQKCMNVSSRHEYFLDMSLPVSVEKPQPPQRRKSSPENNETADAFFINPNTVGPSKSQLKKDKEKERKAKRAAKHHNNKLIQKNMLEDVIVQQNEDEDGVKNNGINDDKESADNSANSTSESDADVEDNLIDDTVLAIGGATSTAGEKLHANLSNMQLCDTNGNNNRQLETEKCGDSPENIEKDSLEEDENDSGIANSPAHTHGTTKRDNAATTEANGDLSLLPTNNSVVSIGLSEKGANLVRQLSLGDSAASAAKAVDSSGNTLINGKMNDEVSAQWHELKLREQKNAARLRASRQRTQSYSDWSNTIAPRYQCEDGECSVQSCLNNFTAVELMTGSNKVGCDNCTRHMHGDDPKAKTVYTNATKQFLVSSPPAVLILHLKRFQIGPRCMFRKLARAVDFPMVLDIAPFCGSKVKNLPNIDRKQKKLIYALYGIVEHSGGMYGGHYVAFVKVRAKLTKDDKRWKFIPQGSKAELDQDDEQRKKLDELLAKQKAREMRLKAAEDSDDYSNSDAISSSETEEAATATVGDAAAATNTAGSTADEAANVQVPNGKWYYVSDSHVTEASEEQVLKAQAYLLFYERIY